MQPCVDSAVDDPEFIAFIDNWKNVADDWPDDWRNAAHDTARFCKLWGCDYFRMTEPPADWDPNLAWYPASFPFGVDHCSENGDFFPVRASPQ